VVASRIGQASLNWVGLSLKHAQSLAVGGRGFRPLDHDIVGVGQGVGVVIRPALCVVLKPRHADGFREISIVHEQVIQVAFITITIDGLSAIQMQ
jgi:hypothetical protein